MKQLVILAAFSAFFFFGCSDDMPTGARESGSPAEQTILDSSNDTQLIAADENNGLRKWTAIYEIMIENLTPATGPGASQPFSPPVFATHNRSIHLFRTGTLASDELARIAEDAVNGPMVARLQESSRVFDIVEGGGVILPGEDGRYEIRAVPNQRWLSVVFMLVNTNDGFGGLDAVKLPFRGEATYYVRAYDAGSELNTESAADIPGPCCGSPGQGNSTSETIAEHAGILGGGDLDPALYGWTGPVAKLTITRVK